MKKAVLISLALLAAALSVAAVAGAREIEKKVPMLYEPATEAAPQGAVFGVSQVPTDTFYYGGTVWDAGDGRWEAAEPVAPGWANRKMWTWSSTGFGGTPHSTLNMDGWVGVDNTADEADYFNVEDGTTIGACATSKVLFCGLTNGECSNACYADQIGTGYGNGWNQMVVTTSATHNAGDVLTLQYDYVVESEPGYDFTYVILQTYDTIASAWTDLQTLATYDDVVSGTDGPINLAAYLSGGEQWRILFQFQSDGGYADEDGYYVTTCGAVWFDNVVVAGTTTNWSENFEGVAINGLPSGWSKYVLGCGDYAGAQHISNLTVPVTLDPCVTAVPGWCMIEDSVLVFNDSDDPGYPHPLCQDNYVVSPVIDFSAHPNLPGRYLVRERFGDLPLNDHVFMYWQVKYKPGCASGGWSPWDTDNYVYYTREGASCANWSTDASAFIPPTATHAQISVGVINYCDEDPWHLGCTYTCNESPYFDNITFGVFGSPDSPYIAMRELDHFQDQFAEDGSLNPTSTADTRSPNYQSDLIPPIFGDTLCARGSADNMEVYFVFRMAKVAPWQPTSHDFFTLWFPGVTGGGWYEARMDTAEVTDAAGISTVAVPGWWMSCFHESDPIAIAQSLPEGTEILPNQLFCPGTRIEYFLKSAYTSTPGLVFTLPDTTNGDPIRGNRFEEFEILPMMRPDGLGSVEWPCMIIADHFGQRGNWGEQNSDRMARHLATLGYDYDMFSKLGPSSDLRNGIGRWAANTGQIGGPGTPKYNWGPGATLAQLVGYKHCILNAGNIYGYSIYQADVDMLTSWLVSLSGAKHLRTLWVSGDQVCREMNRRSPWGPPFLNTVLCVTYLGWSYADIYTDYTYCLPMNGIVGNIACTPKDYYVRMNGCPRKLNEIGISGAAGCNALGEVEYHASFDGTQSIAGVSNSVSIVGGAKYRIYTEGYDFCLIRTDDSQGPRACGADGFLATWIDSVLAWSGFDPSIVCCPPGEPPIPPEATVEWRNLVCDDSRAFVCPACSLVPPGDTCLASWIYVRTTDWFGAPYSGLEIYTQFDATCDMCLCAPVSAVTDDNGEAFLYIRAGLDRAASATCCSVKTRVMCLGVTLFESTKPWLSPDMNADSVVDIDDTIILAGDWLTSACRSDFNCDGIVDSSDWAIFAAHYGHACEPTLVAVGEGLEPRPARRELTQNYPNPFNPYTKITFSLTKPGRVVLRIYSIAGRTVRTLVDAHREPGSYSELWDGRAEDGRELPSGVYFYRLEAGEFMATRKMVLLK